MLQLRPVQPNKQNGVFFRILFIYLAVLGLPCSLGFSLVVVSGGYSLVEVQGLLIMVASLLAEPRL